MKDEEAAKSVADICRNHGISQGTFYGWKTKFSGLEINRVKRMEELETELAQIKKIVAEQTFNITVLKDVIEKGSRPGENRELITYV